MNLTSEDVEEIIRTLDTSCFNELRIKTEKFDLYLRRSQSGWTQEMHTLSAPTVIEASGSNSAVPPTTPQAAEDPPPQTAGMVAIVAPMVGNFYRAPKPGAPPFVDIGSKVGEHTVVGIIETMKLMNSVSAGLEGTVVDICVTDGQLVEAGDFLMRVRQVGA